MSAAEQTPPSDGTDSLYFARSLGDPAEPRGPSCGHSDQDLRRLRHRFTGDKMPADLGALAKQSARGSG